MVKGQHFICRSCIYEWRSRKDVGKPSVCPHCRSYSIETKADKHNRKRKEFENQKKREEQRKQKRERTHIKELIDKGLSKEDIARKTKKSIKYINHCIKQIKQDEIDQKEQSKINRGESIGIGIGYGFLSYVILALVWWFIASIVFVFTMPTNDYSLFKIVYSWYGLVFWWFVFGLIFGIRNYKKKKSLVI
jgi:hypothetical protein